MVICMRHVAIFSPSDRMCGAWVAANGQGSCNGAQVAATSSCQAAPGLTCAELPAAHSSTAMAATRAARRGAHIVQGARLGVQWPAGRAGGPRG